MNTIKPKKVFTSFIEGIRIPLSACPSKVAEKRIAGQWLFEEIDIANIDPAIEKLKKTNLNIWAPVLVWNGVSATDFDWKDEFDLLDIIEKYQNAARKLIEVGCTTLILGADEDGLLHQLLSPRFDVQLSLSERIEILAMIFNLINTEDILAGVALTVEELCPGGTDPTDGIAIGAALEKIGAQFIIANSGTRDFPALKRRRPTKLKSMESMQKLSLELGGSMWLQEALSIPIIAQGHDLSQEETGKLARVIGLAGLVDRLEA